MRNRIGLIVWLLLIALWSIGLGEVYGDWEYSLSSGQVTINGYNGKAAEVIVPETINGRRVTTIGDYAFTTCPTVKSVTFPDSVTRFGYGVFRDNEYIKTVIMPKQMTSLGDSAFLRCKNLTTIHIPDGIITTGEGTFYGCRSLQSIALPDTLTVIDYDAFGDCQALQSITLPSHVTTIRDRAFSHCPLLSSVFFNEGLTAIGDESFSYCTSLDSIVLPDTVTALGKYTFKECSSLTSIKLSKSITSIGEESFYNCKNLLSVFLPDGITSIDTSAFTYCKAKGYCSIDSDTAKSLSKVSVDFGDPHYPHFFFRYEYTDSEVTDLTLVSADSEIVEANIPDGVTKIGYYAFHNHKNLITITFPESVRSIDDIAFNGCTGLTTIALPDSVTSIGIEAFGNCTNLVSISMPKRMSSIAHGAFYECKSLASFTIPSGITTIANGTFFECSSLRSVTIPYGVTVIENEAFRRCSSLSSIVFPNSLTLIGTYSFMSCDSLISVVIPDSVTKLGGGAFAYCSSLSSVILSKGIDKIEGGTFSHCLSLQSIIIPEGVTSIGSWTFSSCNSLHNVSIPDTMTIIEFRVFSQCTSLTNVSIPNSVTSIGSSVFYGCSNLVTVNLPDALTVINSETFYGCTQLQSIEIPDSITLIDSNAFGECSNLHSVSLSDSLKTVGENAFCHTALTSVRLPESLESIGNNAFLTTDDQPIQIYVPSSVATIGADPFAEGSTIYCYASSVVESWANSSDKVYNIVLLDGEHADPIERIIFDDISVIAKGRQTDFHISVFPPNSALLLTFDTSDPDTLTVSDNGLVTSIKEGTADLIIKAGNLTETKTLQVIASAESFELKDILLYVGETQKATLTHIQPSDAALNPDWITGNSEVASIDEDGIITAHAVGNTTYTVIDNLSGVQSHASIHVIGPDTRLEFGQNNYNLYPYQRNKLDARWITDSYSFIFNQAVSFTSDNESVATVDTNGVVIAHQPGTAVITAKLQSNAAPALCTVTVIPATIMNIPDGTRIIERNAFKGTAAEVYVVPDTVTSIGAYAFADLPNAKLIVLPDGIETDPTAFEGTSAEITH